MFKQSIMALALTCITLTAQAEKNAVLLFKDAKAIATGTVSSISEESLKFIKNVEIRNYVSENQNALEDSVKNLKLIFVNNAQEFCAIHGSDTKSVTLSIPACDKKFKYNDMFGTYDVTPVERYELAAVDLIRASVQNLGISDRKQATEIAKAIHHAGTMAQFLVSKPQPNPEPSDKIYTITAAAWCSFGNGSGNVGGWYGKSVSEHKDKAYALATNEAVAKCKNSPAEEKGCRCEVNYTTIRSEKK